MKVSKSLLKAIVVGVTIGGASSCSVITDIELNKKDKEKQHVCDASCNEGCTQSSKTARPDFDCPACGMG